MMTGQIRRQYSVISRRSAKARLLVPMTLRVANRKTLMPKTEELDYLIYYLIIKIGGAYTIQDGIVAVTMKDGTKWDFTEPRKVKED